MDSQSSTKARGSADAYRLARQQAQADQVTAAAQRLANAVPFLPELGAAWSAGLRSLDDLSSGRAADLGQRWNEARAQQRGYADEFQREHPLMGNVLGALGMAAPSAVASGVLASQSAAPVTAPAARSAARRAAGALGTNATAGALASSAYGFSQPGTLDQRLQNARNAFVPGAVGGALTPLALSGAGRAAAALARAPAVAAAIQRTGSGNPVWRTVRDLTAATDIDPRAFTGFMKPLARALGARDDAAWSGVNSLPAPVTTNRILEDPDVIHKFGDVMNDMEDDGTEPLREIPVANDYYSPLFGNRIPDFLLQLPTVEAVDATRRGLLADLAQRYRGSGRLDLRPEDSSLLDKASALKDLLSEGPDLAGQAYRKAFGGGADEPSLWGAFHSAKGKLLDPTLDPGEYGAWFGGLHPFEQQAARAAAANDIMAAVHAERTDVFDSPLVQQRMETAFGSGATADLLQKLKLENLAASMRLPGAEVARGAVEPWDLAKFNAIPRYDPPTNVIAPQPTPTGAILSSPVAAWSAQQAPGQQ